MGRQTPQMSKGDSKKKATDVEKAKKKPLQEKYKDKKKRKEMEQ